MRFKFEEALSQMKTKIEDSLVSGKDDNFSDVPKNLRKIKYYSNCFSNFQHSVYISKILPVHERYF